MKGKGVAIGTIAALVTGIAYGCGSSINKIIVSMGFQIPHVAVMQYLVAAVIMGLVVLIGRLELPTKREFAQLLGLGILLSCTTLLDYVSVNSMSVGKAIALQFQFVWLTCVVQSIIERTLPSRRIVEVIVIVVIGMLLASGLVDEVLVGNQDITVIGVVAALGCAVSYSFYLYLNGRVAIERPPVTRSFCMVLAGLVLTSVFGHTFYMGQCDIVALLPAGVLFAVLMSILPVVGVAIASKYLKGGTVAILTAVQLPVAVIAGFLLVGDQLTPLIIVGVILILAGVVWLQVPERHPKEA